MRSFFRSMPLMTVFSAAIFAAVALSVPAHAQEQMKQVQLSDKQVQNYIAAQKQLADISEKMGDKPDARMQAEMNDIIKKSGFASPDEYASVAENISLVMSGIDPETKAFSEPKVAIQKEIQDVKADNEMSPEEKKQALDELNEAMKSAEPVKFPGNVELVKKYYDQLDKAQ